MRERLTKQVSVYLPESLSEKIKAEAKRIGVSFSEIVRACVENDLPRLRDRNRKRALNRKYTNIEKRHAATDSEIRNK